MDYCVGQAVEQEEGDLCWPVFILWADGTVFCVETGPAQKNWTARGPIQVYPEQEENYSQVIFTIILIQRYFVNESYVKKMFLLIVSCIYLLIFIGS